MMSDYGCCAKLQLRQLGDELKPLEAALADVERKHADLMLLVPNIVSDDTPIGESDGDNVELELPYRVVAVCTGDLSQKNYKQVDIETWMPSRNSYGETHSSSILLDFQARQSNIRYRDDDGELR